MDKSIEKLIELEYVYIQDTINQAIQDRYKLLNFYIGLLTANITVAVTILSFNNTNLPAIVLNGLAILFTLTSATGWVFLVMFVRLRQAWVESVVAMNKLKSYYRQIDSKSFNNTFLWNKDTVPTAYKPFSISFLISFLTSILSSGSLAISIYLIGIGRVEDQSLAILTMAVLLVNLLLQVLFYSYLLKNRK